MESRAYVDGIKVFYQTEGMGEPVVLIHGNGLSHGQWKYNIGTLSQSHKVYALDLPGFGLSDKPEVNYGVSYYVEFMRSFIDARHISNPIIIGHSMGGAVAAEFAAKYPQEVAGLALSAATGISPIGTLYSKELFDVFFSITARSRKLFCRSMFYDGPTSALLDDTMLVADNKESRNAFMKNCRDMMMYDSYRTGLLKSITAPTLILWGQNDLLLPVSDALKYQDSIHGSSVKLFDKCGHIPNVERHEEFNRTIDEFLSSMRHF